MKLIAFIKLTNAEDGHSPLLINASKITALATSTMEKRGSGSWSTVTCTQIFDGSEKPFLVKESLDEIHELLNEAFRKSQLLGRPTRS